MRTVIDIGTAVHGVTLEAGKDDITVTVFSADGHSVYLDRADAAKLRDALAELLALDEPGDTMVEELPPCVSSAPAKTRTDTTVGR